MAGDVKNRSSRAASAAPRGRAHFVGRESELSRLRERLDAAERGDGGIVLLQGEAGIGKSRLLAEFASEARRRKWHVLSGRAYDTEGMPPYLPFLEVLREQAGRSADEDLAALATGAPELCALLPEVEARFPGLPAQRTLGPAGDRFRLFEAVSAFLVAVSRRAEANGLLVVLDDLHWADKTSVLLLKHLAGKLSGVPFVIAGAFRPTELTQRDALSDAIADMERERLCEVVLVPPFGESETADLVESITRSPAAPAFVLSVHHETAGNPFFIEEVVCHLLERGADVTGASDRTEWSIPESVRQVLGQRLSRLSTEANHALQAAAVLGDAFSFRLLQASSELGRESLAGAVEEAERAGMVRQYGDDGYAFAHALVRRTVYDALSVPRRQALHLRAAEALEAANEAGSAVSLAEIAHHWRRCGYPDRAAEHLLRAGDAAIGMTAWEEASRLWEAALECMEQAGAPPARRARLLEGIGDLCFLSSLEVHQCVERYERARVLYESAGDHIGAARASARAGRSLAYPTSGFDFEAAVQHLRAAESILGSGPVSLELGEIYTALAHAESHALRGIPDEMLDRVRRLQAIAERLDNDFLRIGADSAEGHYLGLKGRLAAGLELEQRACDAAAAQRSLIVNKWPERWHEYLLGYSSAEQPDDLSEAGSYQVSRLLMPNMTANCCGLQSLELNDPLSAREKHERLRDAQGRFLSSYYAYDLFLCGDIAALRNMAASGRSATLTLNFERYNPGTEPGVIAALLLDWAEGRWTDVEAGFQGRRQRWRDAGSNSVLVFTNTWVDRVARSMGNDELARAILEESLGVSLASGAVKFEFQARAELALLAAQTRHLTEAAAHLSRVREILAEGEDWRGLGGRAALAEATFAAASGRAAEAEPHFERAIGIFRSLSLPWDEAEAFEVWARVGRRFYRGQTRRAFISQKLDEARAIYRRIGAGQPWLDRLERLSRELAGPGVPSPAPVLPDGLTPREAEVLGLLAAGASSKEIGERLVLSVRTVERHIANIYLKTGTHGRAQAATYALAHSIGAPER